MDEHLSRSEAARDPSDGADVELESSEMPDAIQAGGPDEFAAANQLELAGTIGRQIQDQPEDGTRWMLRP
jgi:hypothetical protein